MLQNAVKLIDQISDNSKNTMFSPLSLDQTLAMLSEGAAGKTKEQIDAFLETENYGIVMDRFLKRLPELNKDVPRWDDEEYMNAVDVANSLWVNDNCCRLKSDYAERIRVKYGALIEGRDFSNNEELAEEINTWCDEKTRHMIPEVVKGSDIDPSFAAVIADSLYFESSWRHDWTIYEDETEDFTLSDGQNKKIPMMYSSTANGYFETDKATAYAYRYVNGLEFIGILPKKEGKFTLEELDIQGLLETRTRDYALLEVKMPRLTFDTDIDLNESLRALGVTEMFTENADFSKLSDDPMFIGKAIQKTRLELDEYGTKAAAITMGVCCGNAMPDYRKIYSVELNRPFAFLIYDPVDKLTLFMGKVNDPTA